MNKIENGVVVAMTAAEIAEFEAEEAARAPERRRIAKSLVLSRLTDAQLEAALALMTARQKERWRAPDHPVVYADDPDVLAVLAAVGADPAVVLAP